VRTVALIALALLVVGCPSKSQNTAQTPPATPPAETLAAAPAETAAAPEPTPKPPLTPAATPTGGILKDTLTAASLPQDLYISIKVKDYGTMKIKFLTKDAPKNITNVANLAIKGFYNGLTFHRLIPGFMIQGGDPDGTGMGGPGYEIDAEIKNKHLKGSMAMARTGDQVNPQKRSSGSQFYICFVPTPFLDGNYTVIGNMVSGEDVLGKLEKVQTGAQDKPTKPVVMESVTVTTN